VGTPLIPSRSLAAMLPAIKKRLIKAQKIAKNNTIDPFYYQCLSPQAYLRASEQQNIIYLT
jgi:hypothetical protein